MKHMSSQFPNIESAVFHQRQTVYQFQHPYVLKPQEVMVCQQSPTLDNIFIFCNWLTALVAYLKVLNDVFEFSIIFLF